MRKSRNRWPRRGQRRKVTLRRQLIAFVLGPLLVLGGVAGIVIAIRSPGQPAVTAHPISSGQAEHKALRVLAAKLPTTDGTWVVHEVQSGTYGGLVPSVKGSQRTIQVYEVTASGRGGLPDCPTGAAPGTKCPTGNQRETAKVVIATYGGAVLWRSLSTS